MSVPILQLFLALLAAPLLPGIVNRTKAIFAGRHGQPLLQGYYDLAKLLSKGAVYSRSTSWVFRAGPPLGLAATVIAMAILPWAGAPSLIAFDGDLVLFAALFGLARFITILAALDTGSAFEGMGASREAWFSALTEPALLLALASLARLSGSLSLSGMLAGQGVARGAGAVLILAGGASFIVFLAENARIPVDDPNTHLELTMIHEVMVLDHSGVDLAYIQYGAMVKLWALGGCVAGILLPRLPSPWANGGIALAAMACVAVLTGIAESVMARLRLARVPQLLVAGVAMAALGLALALVRGGMGA
jgi:formate hydrogenlyase subunit 4